MHHTSIYRSMLNCNESVQVYNVFINGNVNYVIDRCLSRNHPPSQKIKSEGGVGVRRIYSSCICSSD